jgi:hypothetical protein
MIQEPGRVFQRKEPEGKKILWHSIPTGTVSFSNESVAAEPVAAALVDSRKRAADGTPPVEPKPAKSSRRSIAVVPTVSCVTFVTVVNANLQY